MSILVEFGNPSLQYSFWTGLENPSLQYLYLCFQFNFVNLKNALLNPRDQREYIFGGMPTEVDHEIGVYIRNFYCAYRHSFASGAVDECARRMTWWILKNAPRTAV